MFFGCMSLNGGLRNDKHSWVSWTMDVEASDNL